MPNFTITKAEESDLELIVAFIKELAEYEQLSHKVSATPPLLAKALFGPHPCAEVLIARQDEVAVGFALFFTNFSTFVGKPGLYLEDLYIKESHRGKGYGKAILKTLATIAEDRDYGRMEWAVLDWNTSSINFYKSLGAQAMDEWTVFRLDKEAITKLATS